MLDRAVAAIVGLGVPGLVLVVTIAVVGPAGGAAIVAALAALGGPFGMLGGITLLGVLVLACRAIAKYGIDEVFVRVLNGLIETGLTRQDIVAKVERYPISAGLKRKLRELTEKHFGGEDA
jgi:hypothetical protein